MKLKGIILAVILSLASIMMPFPVYAEYVAGGAPIIGVNITYRDINTDYEPYQLTASLEMPSRWQCLSSHSTMGCQVWSSQDTSGNIQDEITGTINVSSSSITTALYEYEFVLDKSYVGWINFSQALSTTTFNQYFVNGNSFTLTSPSLITSFTVTNYHLEYAPLEVIDRFRNFNVPMESYNFVYMLSQNSNIELVDINDLYGYQLPIFQLQNGDNLLQGVNITADKFYLIFGFTRYLSQSTFTNYFSFSDSYSIESFTAMTPNTRIQFYKIVFTKNQNNPFSLQYVNSNDTNIVPVFFKRNYDMDYISTDFALLWGFSNQLLDDIHLIANGTNQSNSAASDLESSNDQMADDMDDLATIESGYNQQFNNQLQSIDFTSPMQNNAGILPAANFVISIFNGLINNNPFSVLIIVVCILLIGKKVIGK